MSQDFALDYEGNCTVEQFSDLSAAAQKRIWKSARWNGWAYILAAGAIYFAILYGIYLFSQSLDRAAYATAPYSPDGLLIIGLIIGIAFTVFVMVMFNVAQRRLMREHGFRASGSYCGPRQYRFDANGIHTVGPHSQSFVNWDAILEMTETKKTLLFWTDTLAAVMVPKDAVGDEPDIAHLKSFAGSQIEARNTGL